MTSEPVEANPLRDAQDRRLPRIAGPCGMVLFGVTGDLSRKKVMPAIYDLANRGLLPPGFCLVGFARRDWADQDFAQVVHDSVKAARPHRVPRGGLEAARRGLPVRAGRLRRRRRLRHSCAGRSRSSTRSAAPAATTRSTSSIPPGFFGDVDRPAQGARPRRPGAGLAGGGSSWRSRSATTSKSGAGAERHPRRGVPARVGVPDRPLPRQGDGAEHPGDAVRQRDVRADLELQLRRPRADHDGRGHRHRRPRRLLRRHRRRPRRHPEPPAAADGAGRDGGADVVRRREPADREAEGALRPSCSPGGST